MLNKIKNKKTNKFKIITSSLLVFFLIVISVYFYFIKPAAEIEQPTVNQLTKNISCQLNRKIDGICLDESGSDSWPVAVMIDNNPDAWPQFGLSAASLVYSTLVEGSTTRLMAIFAGETASKIGPVRSARPYFLSWAKEINALYAHSGGSPEALAKIEDYEILDLNEISGFGSLYFYRDNSGGYSAPHNLFSSTENLSQALIDFNLSTTTPLYVGWQFGNEPTPSTESVDKIIIDYSPGDLFDVVYEYATSSQTFLRFQNLSPHIDAPGGSQLQAKTVIVQFVPKEEHLDVEDRLAIETLGDGQAWIFFNNQIIRGSWQKKYLNSRTKFFDQDNNEIIFPPGQIWIEVVPAGREVTIE